MLDAGTTVTARDMACATIKMAYQCGLARFRMSIIFAS
jgi:hypothetical protein